MQRRLLVCALLAGAGPILHAIRGAGNGAWACSLCTGDHCVCFSCVGIAQLRSNEMDDRLRVHALSGAAQLPSYIPAARIPILPTSTQFIINFSEAVTDFRRQNPTLRVTYPNQHTEGAQAAKDESEDDDDEDEDGANSVSDMQTDAVGPSSAADALPQLNAAPQHKHQNLKDVITKYVMAPGMVMKDDLGSVSSGEDGVQEEDEEEEEGAIEDGAEAGEAASQEGRKGRRTNEYDINDPFVDDSELVDEIYAYLPGPKPRRTAAVPVPSAAGGAAAGGGGGGEEGGPGGATAAGVSARASGGHEQPVGRLYPSAFHALTHAQLAAGGSTAPVSDDEEDGVSVSTGRGRQGVGEEDVEDEAEADSDSSTSTTPDTPSGAALALSKRAVRLLTTGQRVPSSLEARLVQAVARLKVQLGKAKEKVKRGRSRASMGGSKRRRSLPPTHGPASMGMGVGMHPYLGMGMGMGWYPPPYPPPYWAQQRGRKRGRSARSDSSGDSSSGEESGDSSEDREEDGWGRGRGYGSMHYPPWGYRDSKRRRKSKSGRGEEAGVVKGSKRDALNQRFLAAKRARVGVGVGAEEGGQGGGGGTGEAGASGPEDKERAARHLVDMLGLPAGTIELLKALAPGAGLGAGSKEGGRQALLKALGGGGQGVGGAAGAGGKDGTGAAPGPAGGGKKSKGGGGDKGGGGGTGTGAGGVAGGGGAGEEAGGAGSDTDSDSEHDPWALPKEPTAAERKKAAERAEDDESRRREFVEENGERADKPWASKGADIEELLVRYEKAVRSRAKKLSKWKAQALAIARAGGGAGGAQAAASPPTTTTAPQAPEPSSSSTTGGAAPPPVPPTPAAPVSSSPCAPAPAPSTPGRAKDGSLFIDLSTLADSEDEEDGIEIIEEGEATSAPGAGEAATTATTTAAAAAAAGGLGSSAAGGLELAPGQPESGGAVGASSSSSSSTAGGVGVGAPGTGAPKKPAVQRIAIPPEARVGPKYGRLRLKDVDDLIEGYPVEWDGLLGECDQAVRAKHKGQRPVAFIARIMAVSKGPAVHGTSPETVKKHLVRAAAQVEAAACKKRLFAALDGLAHAAGQGQVVQGVDMAALVEGRGLPYLLQHGWYDLTSPSSSPVRAALTSCDTAYAAWLKAEQEWREAVSRKHANAAGLVAKACRKYSEEQMKEHRERWFMAALLACWAVPAPGWTPSSSSSASSASAPQAHHGALPVPPPEAMDCLTLPSPPTCKPHVREGLPAVTVDSLVQAVAEGKVEEERRRREAGLGLGVGGPTGQGIGLGVGAGGQRVLQVGAGKPPPPAADGMTSPDGIRAPTRGPSAPLVPSPADALTQAHGGTPQLQQQAGEAAGEAAPRSYSSKNPADLSAAFDQPPHPDWRQWQKAWFHPVEEPAPAQAGAGRRASAGTAGGKAGKAGQSITDVT